MHLSYVNPTAQAVIEYADVILKQEEESFADFVHSRLSFFTETVQN